jgi:hypothetical protein
MKQSYGTISRQRDSNAEATVDTVSIQPGFRTTESQSEPGVNTAFALAGRQRRFDAYANFKLHQQTGRLQRLSSR